MLADQFNTLQMGVVSAERIFKVLDTQEFISNHPNAIPAPQAGDKQTVHVRFDNVNFYYNPEQPILKNISFEVYPGTTTALVGATGSGKSTIISILLRLYEIQSGQILINQIPLQSYELNSLHQITSLVLQDVFLFSGTIFDNITLYRKDITLEAVQQASEEVGAHKFIERLPGGYFYRVGERGGSLSAGQRQLIAFIRSLVFNPNLLLLDEATANIDSETELLIQKAIAKILYKRTAIIVAHRLSTIQQAHQILVIHKGEIVERGNHQELLAQKGRYYKLYRLQYEVTERMKTSPPFITT
jgi:ATP-binding cassette subfamily B protein